MGRTVYGRMGLEETLFNDCGTPQALSSRSHGGGHIRINQSGPMILSGSWPSVKRRAGPGSWGAGHEGYGRKHSCMAVKNK